MEPKVLTRALLLALALAACSPRPLPPSSSSSPSCPAPDPRDPPIPLNGSPLPLLCRALYVDPASTPEDRASLKRWYADSLRTFTAFFGDTKRPPPVTISCKTEACELHFSGPTRRSRAMMTPRPTIVVNGIGALTKGTIVHEMVHVEVVQRMGERRSALPTSFDEGVATFIGDNAWCPPGTKRAIDDLRRLDAPSAWDGFTNMAGKMEPAYCQARDEIAAWAARRDRSALLEIIDAVTGGRPFDDVYGPLVNAITPESFDRSLDARFPLDENVGTSAVDQSGRFHIASLVNGPIWTTGRRGAAVKVLGGSYVRADGFAEFGVPDSPFSISLWAKPLVNAKVLVHTSKNANGSNGWCVPLLGHDATGHLVAQVNFADDPKAFVIATGPVLPLATWSHVVTTWTATDGLRLYVNGALAASAKPRSPEERHRTAAAAPAYLFFGSSNDSHCWSAAVEPGHWNGALDDLRVFTYALTPDQVTSDMRGP